MPRLRSPRTPPRLHSETHRPSIFWLMAVIIIPLISLISRFKVADSRKLPDSGAYVIAPNHYSEIDPVMIGAVVWKLGRAPRFLAKAGLFRVPVLGWFLRRSGQIPVERAGSVRGSDPLGAASQLVEHGRSVIIYSEGTLTRDPELWPMRGKTGAARVALEQGIPVIPVAHWGAQLVLPRYSKKISLFPRKTITVKFGDPVDLTEFEGKPIDNAALTAATDKIMSAITSLLEDLRGRKAPEERWNPSAHHQSESGRFEA